MDPLEWMGAVNVNNAWSVYISLSIPDTGESNIIDRGFLF